MLYHCQVFMPKDLPLPQGKIELTYSDHALRAAQNRNAIVLPKEIEVRFCKVIEVETDSNKVTKVVYRKHYDAQNDIILVVNVGNGLVKTVWLNRKNDFHQTVDKKLYDRR